MTQETFLSAYKHLASFDNRNPKSWLATIAANKCRDFLKSPARKVSAVDTEDLALICDPDESVEHQVENRIGDETVLRLCSRLKEPYRSVATAYYCFDKTITEISAQTGDNPKTVATRLYRAKSLLKAMVKEESTCSCSQLTGI